MMCTPCPWRRPCWQLCRVLGGDATADGSADVLRPEHLLRPSQVQCERGVVKIMPAPKLFRVWWGASIGSD